MTIGVRSASNRPGYQRDAQGMQASQCGLQASARDQAAGVLCCAHVLRAELCSALLLYFATQNTPPS